MNNKTTLLILSLFVASTIEAQINFQQAITLSDLEGIHNSSIAFADVDGDNDMDLMITGKISSNEYISKLYTNNGSGNYIEVTGTPFEGVGHGSIAFADVDGDNDMDLMMTGINSSIELISKLYTNDGSGNYTEVTDTPFEGVTYSSIAFTDVDGDDDMDLLITGENNIFEHISKLYTNDSNGNYTEVTSTPFEGVTESSIAFTDVDGDDDMDLLITGQNNLYERISKLYTNDSNGNYTEVTSTPFEDVKNSSIAFADVDGDNDMDLMITGTNSSYEIISTLYTNDGSGNYTEVIASPFDGVKSGSIAHADIDGDSDMDLLITGKNNSDELIAKLYTNDENGNYTEVTDAPFTGVSRSAIAFADVDGDDDLDVLITGVDGPPGTDGFEPISSKLYTNDGNGNYTEATETPIEGVAASAIAFADVDGDNDLDFAITGANNSNELVTLLYTNDGTGNFTEVTDTPFVGATFGSIAFADIDGDNDQDILITGRPLTETGISKLYTNDGSGNYAEVIDTAFDDIGFSSVAFADVDSDNDLDLMMTGANNEGEAISKLYSNDGSGNYTEVTDTPFEGVYIGSTAFADVDSDNDLDLITTGYTIESEPISKLYSNDGSGNYTEATSVLFEGVVQSSISFADVDGDNDLDLMITGANNFNENISKLYINKTPQTVFATDEQIACNTFTWIDDITYTEDNTTAQQTFIGGAANGADSIVTLNLTINSVTDLSTSVDVATITANNENGTYQWLNCDNDYSIIEGATEISFTPDVNGNYALEITENGNACVDTTSCVAITTVGLIENKTNDVVVYPNPTNGVFNISLKSDLEEVHITVIDMLGKKVYAKTYANTNSIDLELKQPSGMYFVEVRTKESSKTIRLIKK